MLFFYLYYIFILNVCRVLETWMTNTPTSVILEFVFSQYLKYHINCNVLCYLKLIYLIE